MPLYCPPVTESPLRRAQATAPYSFMPTPLLVRNKRTLPDLHRSRSSKLSNSNPSPLDMILKPESTRMFRADVSLTTTRSISIVDMAREAEVHGSGGTASIFVG